MTMYENYCNSSDINVDFSRLFVRRRTRTSTRVNKQIQANEAMPIGRDTTFVRNEYLRLQGFSL